MDARMGDALQHMLSGAIREMQERGQSGRIVENARESLAALETGCPREYETALDAASDQLDILCEALDKLAPAGHYYHPEAQGFLPLAD